jgi:hypothetical protein
MARRRGLLLAVGVAIAIGLVPTGEGASIPAAPPSLLPIVFSSTLPSWPPPDDLNAQSLYIVSVAGGKPVLLDRAETPSDYIADWFASSTSNTDRRELRRTASSSTPVLRFTQVTCVRA